MAKTTLSFNSDHTIRQYAHGLLLESPFVPSSRAYQLLGCTGKNNAKTAVPLAVEMKPEVEIWWQPKKSTFWPWFPIHSFHFATIQTSQMTDRQHSVPEARQIVQLAKNWGSSKKGKKPFTED